MAQWGRFLIHFQLSMTDKIKSLEMSCNLTLKRMTSDGPARQLDAHENAWIHVSECELMIF